MTTIPKINIQKSTDAPNITITEEIIEDLTGMATGATISDIIVECADGRRSRFFVRVRMNKQGRPVCEVSTETAERTISKKVTGYKR